MLGCGNPCSWSISYTWVLRHSTAGPGPHELMVPKNMLNPVPIFPHKEHLTGTITEVCQPIDRWYPYPLRFHPLTARDHHALVLRNRVDMREYIPQCIAKECNLADATKEFEVYHPAGTLGLKQSLLFCLPGGMGIITIRNGPFLYPFFLYQSAMQNESRCDQVPRLPRKVSRRHGRLIPAQARHQSQPSAISATPATQNEGGCRQVPNLPRKVPRRHLATNPSPRAPPEPAQCHACQAKRR